MYSSCSVLLDVPDTYKINTLSGISIHLRWFFVSQRVCTAPMCACTFIELESIGTCFLRLKCECSQLTAQFLNYVLVHLIMIKTILNIENTQFDYILYSIYS